MSRTEYHHGTLRDTGLTVSAFILTLPQDKRPDSDDLSWCYLEDWFREEYYGKALVIDDTVWVADNKTQDPDDGIFEATKNEDGSYSYVLQYYNGGCCWEEALLSALGKS